MRPVVRSLVLAPIVLAFLAGCSRDAEGGPGPAADAAASDVAADGSDAAADAPADVTWEEGIDVLPDTCRPAVYDCRELFRAPVSDGGAADAGDAGDAAPDAAGDAAQPPAPGIVVDAQAATVTVVLSAAAPPVVSASATLSYVSTADSTKCKTPALGDVALTVAGATLSAALPSALTAPPEDFSDWCGTLHLTDACGVVTDVPMFPGYLPDVDVGGVQCAGTCGADQWKAAGSGICADCPLPSSLNCRDLPNPTFTGAAFTFAPGWNGPAFSATELTFSYMTNADDSACSGAMTVTLARAADGSLSGTMPSRPGDFFQFCRGNVTLAAACGQHVDFALVGYDSNTDLTWGTACSD